MTHNSNVENGFVGCTLIRVTNTDVAWKRIDEIQVGDMVMAMPESGIGEPIPKHVTKTFKHENKAVWHVGITPHEDGWGHTSHSFAGTPDHPFCVYGFASKIKEAGEYNPIDFYDLPQWKPINELMVGDVLYSPTKNKYYLVNSVKPFAKNFAPEYAWLQGGMPMLGWQFEQIGTDWQLESEGTGIFDDSRIMELGKELDGNDDNIVTDESIKPYPVYALSHDSESGDVYHTGSKALGTQYAPYTTTVYNIEVEDYHSYLMGGSDILVKDMQS